MSDTENIVRDIFGDSDESDDEFEGFDGDQPQQEKKLEKSEDQVEGEEKEEEEEEDNLEKELEKPEKSSSDAEDEEAKENQEEDKLVTTIEEDKKIIPDISSDEDEHEPKAAAPVAPSKPPSQVMYDFDIMLQKRKEINSRRRRRKNVDIINDSDDIIAELMNQMRDAYERDLENNRLKRAATAKLTLLQSVESQLRKIDLRETLLDSGILGVITDWLSRLPDGSLPHLKIRETMLKILVEYNVDDIDRIKSSGVGRAVMYLFKHPKETRENKKIASQLISNWSRPIFNLDTDFHSISREEREQRDLNHKQSYKRSLSTEAGSSKGQEDPNKVIRPGDKGWVPRARVPMPSMKDYVVRPKSNVDVDMSRISSKKTQNRYEKHLRNFQNIKRNNKTARAVPISIEGRKMAL